MRLHHFTAIGPQALHQSDQLDHDTPEVWTKLGECLRATAGTTHVVEMYQSVLAGEICCLRNA